MAKAIITVGYKYCVLDAQDALKVVELLTRAEIYESLCVKDSDGNYTTTKHVYPQESEDTHVIQIMNDNQYRMAKLAGKPQKECPTT
jgi:fructose 1,6-bisphosphatase